MIEDLFSKLAPVLGEEKMNKLWLLYQTEADLEKRREIEGVVHSLAAKHLNENYQNNKILLPPPETRNPTDGIFLGTIHYGDEPRSEFRLPIDHLLLHCGIFGATGAGKTNLCFLIVKQLLERKIPFMIFDWKRNYRDVLETEWGREKDIIIYTVGRDIVPFSFDPLTPPPGTDRETWESKVIDILCHSHFLGHGVRYWLKILLNATAQHSLQGLLNAIRQTKAVGRPRQWLDSALRAVGDLCLGHAGRVFNSNPIEKIEDLLSRNVIFELDALGEDAKKFFIELLLAWIHQYRLTQSSREIMRHVLVIEEAHHILQKERAYQEKETIMDITFREIRELSEAIILTDQHPSEISKPALGNTGTTVIMRLKHADDVRASADSILLDHKDRDYIGQLPTGFAIVKAPEIAKPFLVRIPLVEMKKGLVTDEMLKEKYRGYSALNEVIPPVQNQKEDVPSIPSKDKVAEGNEEKLTELEVRFLKDILDHSASGVVERYRRLGLTTQKGTNLKQALIQKRIIREHSISTGNGAIKFLEVTQAGCEALRRSVHDVSAISFSTRYGGPEHRYWVEIIANEMRTHGFQVEKEYPIGEGKTVDIVATKNGKKIAVEVETGKSSSLENITKDLGQAFDNVLVFTTSTEERKKILDQLSNDRDELDYAQSAHRIH